MNKASAAFSNIANQLKEQPSVKAAQGWYQAQSPRDQKIVQGAGVFVIICLVILLLIQPVLSSKEKYRNKLDKSIATYEKLALNAHKFGGANRSSSGNSSGRPVMSVVTAKAKQYNLNLKRFEPDGEGLRIWLENVSFDSAISMLEELNRVDGILITQINADQTEASGRVNLRASLSR